MNIRIGEIDLCDFYPLRAVKQVLCSFPVAIDPDEDAALEAGCAPCVKRSLVLEGRHELVLSLDLLLEKAFRG